MLQIVYQKLFSSFSLFSNLDEAPLLAGKSQDNKIQTVLNIDMACAEVCSADSENCERHTDLILMDF